MSTVTIDGGQLLLASEDDRVLSARLVPYGVECRSNLGRFTVGAGVLTMPEDATVAILNDGHRREVPLAAGIVYAEQADGVHASWRVAKGKAGDEALADIKSGKRTAVSVEAEVVIEGGKATSGRIFGAALVSPGKQPAFPGALLMATAEDDIADPEDPTVEHYSNSYLDPVTGETVDSETVTEEETEVDAETGATTTTRTTTVTTITTPGTPAEGGAPVAAQPTVDPLLAERETNAARVPQTLLRGGRAKQKAAQPAAPAAPAGVDLRTLLAMLAKAAPRHERGTWNQSVLEELRGVQVQGTLLAELEDITFDAAGSPSAMIVPQWIGELWSGRAFLRRWIPLFNSGTLTGPTIKGWRWKTKPEVEKWSGNKTPVPSNAVETEGYDVEAQPFAMAHDIDRRFRDFNVTEFWDGYFKAGTESYAKKSDLYVPEELFNPANHATTDVVAGTVPANVSPVLAKIVDGALAVLDEDLPSFAVVSKADYRDLMLVRDQDNLAFLNASLGLEEGTIDKFRVMPSTHSTLTTGNKTLVGCKSAATVHELPGAPIRIEGLDVALGGIDPGLFGYTAVVVHNAAALALVRKAS